MGAKKTKKKKVQKANKEKKKQKKIEKQKKRRAKAQAEAKRRHSFSDEWEDPSADPTLSPADAIRMRRKMRGHNNPPSKANFTYCVNFEGPSEHIIGRTITINGKCNFDDLHAAIVKAFDLPESDYYKFSPLGSDFLFASKAEIEYLEDVDVSLVDKTNGTCIGSIAPTDQKRIRYQIRTSEDNSSFFELVLTKVDETSPLKTPEITRAIGQLEESHYHVDIPTLEELADDSESEAECQCDTYGREICRPSAQPDYREVSTQAFDNKNKPLGEQSIDFLFEGAPKNEDELEYLCYLFIELLWTDHFLLWEAELCRRQSLPLTKYQQTRLEKALYALGKDEALEQMSTLKTINAPTEIFEAFELDEYNWPCPQKPWYEYARKLLDYLLIDKLTIDTPVFHHTFANDFLKSIAVATDYLTLPEGCELPLEIAATDKWCKLVLQSCLTPLMDALCVVEYEDSDEDEITNLVEITFDNLKSNPLIENKEWITFNKIVEMVEMPKVVKDIFTKVAKEQYHMKTGDERLIELFAIHI